MKTKRKLGNIPFGLKLKIMSTSVLVSLNLARRWRSVRKAEDEYVAFSLARGDVAEVR